MDWRVGKGDPLEQSTLVFLPFERLEDQKFKTSLGCEKRKEAGV